MEGDEAEGTKGEFELVVTVVEARNLTSADYNGLSDPYAKLTVSSAVRKPDLPVQFLYACPPPHRHHCYHRRRYGKSNVT